MDQCELLTEALNPMYHNGYNPARRDKYQMNEAVKIYGLRTVRQAMCHTKEEALAFAQNELGVVSQSDLEVFDDAKETDEKEQSIIKKK